jgi:hypothetical protein
MMKRLRLAVLVCVCVLAPAVARADNGGFLDWLYSLDPKLIGFGTDFHLCLDESNQVKNCEDWFGLRHKFSGEPLVTLADIRHELDFRVAYYRKYGERFSDVSDTRSINAFKLMVLYYYISSDKHLSTGFGAGFMPFFGDGFESFSRGILTPISIIYSPAARGPANTTGDVWKKAFIIRAESTYITTGFTGADFGNSATAYTTRGGEWNFSVALVFYLRRAR